MSRLLLSLLCVVHLLPLGLQAGLGRLLGAAGWRVVSARRKVALRNLELCFPELPLPERVACSGMPRRRGCAG